MIIEAALAAIGNITMPQLRSVFFKTLGLTILVLIGLWFAAGGLLETFAFDPLAAMLPDMPGWAGWLGFVAAILAGLALAIGLGLLIAPVTALIAGFFQDDVAELVERENYPNDPPGRALPFASSVITSIKFLGLVLAGNLLALVLLLVPGVNIVAFLVVNGYLLGREFFEFAAMRFHDEAEAKALRRRHAGTVFAGGMVIALLLSVPILNLLTPIFAAAMMVHLYKAVAAADAGGAIRRNAR